MYNPLKPNLLKFQNLYPKFQSPALKFHNSLSKFQSTVLKLQIPTNSSSAVFNIQALRLNDLEFSLLQSGASFLFLFNRILQSLLLLVGFEID